MDRTTRNDQERGERKGKEKKSKNGDRTRDRRTVQREDGGKDARGGPES